MPCLRLSASEGTGSWKIHCHNESGNHLAVNAKLYTQLQDKQFFFLFWSILGVKMTQMKRHNSHAVQYISNNLMSLISNAKIDSPSPAKRLPSVIVVYHRRR